MWIHQNGVLVRKIEVAFFKFKIVEGGWVGQCKSGFMDCSHESKFWFVRQSLSSMALGNVKKSNANCSCLLGCLLVLEFKEFGIKFVIYLWY